MAKDKDKKKLTPFEKKTVRVYKAIGVPIDRLPYSDEFEEFQYRLRELSGYSLNDQELWKHLVGMRKGGKLPRLFR